MPPVKREFRVKGVRQNYNGFDRIRNHGVGVLPVLLGTENKVCEENRNSGSGERDNTGGECEETEGVVCS